MSKRLPYFQFEPAEYLAGDIMFCSYGAQGIFNSICALYWQKDCELKYSQVIKRLGNEELIKELVSEKIIKVENDNIVINFLDEQYSKATEKSKTNSSNGSKGALKRWGKNSESDSEIIATPLNNDSESIALREDKIIKDKIKEDNNIPPTAKFSFFNSLLNLGIDKQLANDWIAVRKTKKLTNTQTAFNNLKKEFDKCGKPIHVIIEKCVNESWGGFKASWDWKEYAEPNNNGIGKTNQKIMTYDD